MKRLARQIRPRAETSADEQGSSTPPACGGYPSIKPDLVALAIGIAIAFVVLAPYPGNGYLMTLDWVPGPNMDLPRTLWGLDGGLTTSVLFHVSAWGLSEIFGGDVATLLMFGAFFPMCMVSMCALVPGRFAGMVAGLIYALGPMVADRMWVGQIAFLLGYAILPFLLRSLLIARHAHGVDRIRPAVWLAIAGALSPHFLWIGALLVGAVVLASKPNLRTVRWVAGIALATVALASYILPSLDASAGGFSVSDADTSAYATSTTTPLGVFGSLALLQGFWRDDPMMPDVPFALAITVFVLLAGLAVVGIAKMRTKMRELTLALVGASVAGYLLALGQRGPTGELFSWAFDNLPGFAIMREPQKFACLLALGLAVFAGVGASALAQRAQLPIVRAFAFTLLAALPLLLAPNMLFGFNGALEPAEYPQEWERAATTMGNGEGSILMLPWHQYATQSFTDGRVVAQAGTAFFERPVIQGDNVELPGLSTSSQSPRSAYLESLFARGNSVQSFGQLTAPLGVEYVVVAKNNDWKEFSWLAAQQDLQLVQDDAEISVYRNLEYSGVGFAIEREIAVESIDVLIARSNTEDLAGAAIRLDRPLLEGLPADVDTTITRKSTVEYAVQSNNGGYLALSEQDNPSWSSRVDYSSIYGTLLVQMSPNDRSIDFSLWREIKLTYALSVIALIAIWAALAWPVRRRFRKP